MLAARPACSVSSENVGANNVAGAVIALHTDVVVTGDAGIDIAADTTDDPALDVESWQGPPSVAAASAGRMRDRSIEAAESK